MLQLELLCPANTGGACLCHAHNGFLTRKGYEAVAEAEQALYLDKVGSVSAMDEDEGAIWDDELLDSQHRRFLNGLSL